MSDIFNIQAPPLGFNRAGNGWLVLRKTPASKAIYELKSRSQELRKENIELRDRLASLEKLVTSLVETNGGQLNGS